MEALRCSFPQQKEIKSPNNLALMTLQSDLHVALLHWIILLGIFHICTNIYQFIYFHVELEVWLVDVFLKLFHLQICVFMYLFSNRIQKLVLKGCNFFAMVDCSAMNNCNYHQYLFKNIQPKQMDSCIFVSKQKIFLLKVAVRLHYLLHVCCHTWWHSNPLDIVQIKWTLLKKK